MLVDKALQQYQPLPHSSRPTISYKGNGSTTCQVNYLPSVRLTCSLNSLRPPQQRVTNIFNETQNNAKPERITSSPKLKMHNYQDILLITHQFLCIYSRKQYIKDIQKQSHSLNNIDAKQTKVRVSVIDANILYSIIMFTVTITM